jgi:hopanoid C-3 methylase
VAINLIADTHWDETHFRQAQEWATAVPEIVHLTVATPYPGTELFHTDSREFTTKDYRLFDIQHAVTSTRLPLRDFYTLLVETQSIINRKFMGWRNAVDVANLVASQLIRGQTNFVKMLFKFARAYNVDRFYGDHAKPVRYEMRPPTEAGGRRGIKDRVIHVRHEPTVTPHCQAA